MKPRFAWVLCSLLLSSGCSALAVRSQSPEDEVELLGSAVQVVGDMAVPFGMTPITVEAIGLITGLPGTGSDPAPSPQRASLVAEMQTRGVLNPNQVLASPTTELVMVRGYLRPGIQKGDHFDIEVRTLGRSECTSLRGGWLMETRLREMAVLDNRVHEGTLMALAVGPVLVDPSATDKVGSCRGRILRGATSTTTRELGLVIRPEDRNVMVSSQIGTAVNRRFHTFNGGLKEGVAKPKTDEFIVLKVHPRYKDNLERYMRVVRSIPLRETPAQQLARTKLLERQLLDPITSAMAALRLEALGKDGVETLRKGIADTEEEEVRFYAAEALAYLDQGEAAAPLGKLAHDVPPFRAYALAALSAMDDYAAYEALRELLKVPSAETRYGAFRSLWAMNSRDSLVRGEDIGGQFSYHILDVEGPPMIHVTRSYRPEIVLFGNEQRLSLPLALEAGKEILITGQGDDKVAVSRFAVDQPDQKRVVSTRVDDVIRAIIDVGGMYPDVVQALQQAKKTGALSSRFEIDAIPREGRNYLRKSSEPDENGNTTLADSPEIVVGTPLPDLFSKRLPDDKAPRRRSAASDDDSDAKKPAEKEKATPLKSILGKIVGSGD